MVVVILSVGAYYGYRNEQTIWDVLDPLLDSASRIIASGFFPMLIAARILEAHDFPDLFLASFAKELRTLAKDAPFPFRVWHCYHLMKRISIIDDLPLRTADAIRESGISEEILNLPLEKPLWVELYSVDTGEVFQKAVGTLFESITFSLLHPGLAHPKEGIYNSMYLTPFPCISLIEETGQTVTFLSSHFTYRHSRPITRYLKTLQFIRSEDLCRRALDHISRHNTVTEIEL
ncbi:MAG TPA: hypothetical protein PLY35_08205 [Thermotogota bacterium]|nr:hypothetical protein [Thermotogota bacterium]